VIRSHDLTGAREAGSDGRGEHPHYRGPVIDIHVHYDAGTRGNSAMVNAVGGLRSAITLWDLTWPPRPYDQDIAAWRQREPGLLRCHVPDFSMVGDPSFERSAQVAVAEAAAAGCIGLKVWKNFGLWLADTAGRRIAIDDSRVGCLWEAAAEHRLPVLIHSGDPPEFWQPIDERNPRYNDVKDHPDWWYGSRDVPPLGQLQDELEAVVARHPRTTFIGAHWGCFVRDLDRWFETYPNYHVDTSAAVAEMGKGDVSEVRRICIEWSDRILFGTDLVRVAGEDYPHFAGGRWLEPELRLFFERHWRFFETGDSKLDHPIPEQLPWKVTGLALPHPVLERLYFGNAVRLYGLSERGLTGT
jgi:predicted TIM-barrel fold metal-dependent hydrolase